MVRHGVVAKIAQNDKLVELHVFACVCVVLRARGFGLSSLEFLESPPEIRDLGLEFRDFGLELL